MQSRTRAEYVDVEVPNAPQGYGISYANSPTKSQNVKFEESITWDGNGREASHYCVAHKTNKYNEGNLAVFPVRYANWKWRLTGKADWDLEGPMVNQEYASYPCSNPRNTKEVSPSEDEIADRINSAAVTLNSLPIRSMMNLPQAIIELKDIPKTVRAVPQLVNFLKSPYALNKGYGIFMNVKELASAYLAYVFGVRPTLTDVNNFMGQVPDRVKVGVRQVRYTKGQKVRVGLTVKGEELGDYTMASTSQSGWAGYAAGSPGMWQSGTPFITWAGNSTSIASKGTTVSKDWPWLADWKVVSKEITGCIYGRVAADYAHDFSMMDDISINGSLLSTAWELIPFSFVVDWFADLGKWIKDANRLTEARRTGFHLADGIWISKRTSSVTYWPILSQVWAESPRYEPGQQWSVKFTVSTTKAVKMVELYRNVDYSRTILMDQMRLPHLNLKGLANQGAFQWASGTALAIQACGG